MQVGFVFRLFSELSSLYEISEKMSNHSLVLLARIVPANLIENTRIKYSCFLLCSGTLVSNDFVQITISANVDREKEATSIESRRDHENNHTQTISNKAKIIYMTV